MQDDWCDQHPSFDPENPPLNDEPFWPTIGQDQEIGPTIPVVEFPLRKRMTQKQFQQSLF